MIAPDIAKDTSGWRVVQARRLGPPEPGFAGPGHTAVEVIAPDALMRTDPFVLLMDDRVAFAPGQQVGGPHPHAGLETVTFVLEGSLEDRDEGTLGPDDVVWMTAGSGVIHNEDVRIPTGRARVLQLWITLPEVERHAPPRLDLLRAADLPVHRAPGVEARLYSGRTHGLVSTTRNFVPVTLVDVRLEPGASFEEELPASYNGFLVPLGGAVRVTGSAAPLRTGEIGWLDLRDGDEPTRLRFTAEDGPARVLLYAGLRQREETVQRGPFVAGSLAGIAEMYRAYQRGRFIPVSRLRTR